MDSCRVRIKVTDRTAASEGKHFVQHETILDHLGFCAMLFFGTSESEGRLISDVAEELDADKTDFLFVVISSKFLHRCFKRV